MQDRRVTIKQQLGVPNFLFTIRMALPRDRILSFHLLVNLTRYKICNLRSGCAWRITTSE